MENLMENAQVGKKMAVTQKVIKIIQYFSKVRHFLCFALEAGTTQNI